MTTIPRRKHPLHESIEKHNIQRVAVVDDAFDPVSLASLQEGEDQEFIDAVNSEDGLLQEFHSVVSEKDSADLLRRADLTDEAVGLLWQKRKALRSLGPVVSGTLFRVLEHKVSQVETLCAFLKDGLGIKTIERCGTNSETPDDKFDLAFIDYRFGPSLQEESVKRAVRWATRMYEKSKAFIILMSAEAEACVKQEIFRRDSKLTRGLFEFVDKAEFADSGKFSNRLNTFCAGFHTRHEIHQFATAAEAAIGEAVVSLTQSIHALGLEDYAYLEQISLREDGHPLGDYVLWLLGEYFGHELAVNEALQPARNRVNGLKYERFLPLQRPPSVVLAKMYSAAITEPVHEGWNAHPRGAQENKSVADTSQTPLGQLSVPLEANARPATPALGLLPSNTILAAPGLLAYPKDAQRSKDGGDASHTPLETGTAEVIGQTVTVPAARESAVRRTVVSPPADTPLISDSMTRVQPDPSSSAEGLPLYQLGDLLVADKHKPVFLVLNAGCDLQFSPGERDCDPEQTILLLPGRFESLHERGGEVSVKRTELFELDGERFRIIWQHRRARALPYYKIRGEYEPKGYRRTSRLKLPYALEIQQHFAAQLTRVGVPTPTPVFQERPAQVYGKDADGKYVKIGTVTEGVVIFHHRERDQFILTVDCVHEILDFIDLFVAESESALGNRAPDAPPDERFKRRKKYIETVVALRRSLPYRCEFQDILTDVPAVQDKVTQVDKADASKRVELEVYNTNALMGRYESGAPIVLAFSVMDDTASSSVEAVTLSDAGTLGDLTS